MVVELPAADTFHGAHQEPLFPSDLLGLVLGAPLKGGVGLGDEGGHADREPKALAPLLLGHGVEQAGDLLGQLRDAQHVLVGLRGEADHEVQLDAVPSGLEGVGAGP